VTRGASLSFRGLQRPNPWLLSVPPLAVHDPRHRRPASPSATLPPLPSSSPHSAFLIPSPPTHGDARRSADSHAHAEELRSGPRRCRSEPPAARSDTSMRAAALHVLHDSLLLLNTDIPFTARPGRRPEGVRWNAARGRGRRRPRGSEPVCPDDHRNEGHATGLRLWRWSRPIRLCLA
jgi:hypothetical protein